MGDRDFLAPQYGQVDAPAPPTDIVSMANFHLLRDIRRELRKQTPDVLTVSTLQGGNSIPQNDTSDHRVFFEVARKAATVYRLVVYSTYSGKVYFSVNSMGTIRDGIEFSRGDVRTFDIVVDSVHIKSDGAQILPLNGPTDSTNGGIFIYAWTISTFDEGNE